MQFYMSLSVILGIFVALILLLSAVSVKVVHRRRDTYYLVYRVVVAADVSLILCAMAAAACAAGQIHLYGLGDIGAIVVFGSVVFVASVVPAFAIGLMFRKGRIDVLSVGKDAGRAGAPIAMLLLLLAIFSVSVYKFAGVMGAPNDVRLIVLLFTGCMTPFLWTAVSPLFIEATHSTSAFYITEALPEAMRLLATVNLDLNAVRVIEDDGGRYSAFVCGILPEVRRVFFTRTLVAALDTSDTVAILGHELAHLKLGHSIKMMVANLAALLAMGLLFTFIGIAAYGISLPLPLGVGASMLCFLASRLLLIYPLSRRFEKEADLLASSWMSNAESVGNALQSHASFAGLGNRRLMWRWLDSHPSLAERLNYLKR